jgi:hypothetical protein
VCCNGGKVQGADIARVESESKFLGAQCKPSSKQGIKNLFTEFRYLFVTQGRSY